MLSYVRCARSLIYDVSALAFVLTFVFGLIFYGGYKMSEKMGINDGGTFVETVENEIKIEREKKNQSDRGV